MELHFWEKQQQRSTEGDLAVFSFPLVQRREDSSLLYTPAHNGEDRNRAGKYPEHSVLKHQCIITFNKEASAMGMLWNYYFNIRNLHICKQLWNIPIIHSRFPKGFLEINPYLGKEVGGGKCKVREQMVLRNYFKREVWWNSQDSTHNLLWISDMKFRDSCTCNPRKIALYLTS